MCEVILHVYDVTASENDRTNSTITAMNGITHTLGLGGVFHGALEVYGEEWSFGFVEEGTGVYACPPRKNPLYTFRQSVSLGRTNKTPEEVAGVLRRIRRDWQGYRYDLLTQNCCHFCEDFAERLGCNAVPLWLNRLATGAESAILFTDKLIQQVSWWGQTLRDTSQNSMTKLRGVFNQFLNASVSDTDGSFCSAPLEGGYM